MDELTRDLISRLLEGDHEGSRVPAATVAEIAAAYGKAAELEAAQPIVDLFRLLSKSSAAYGVASTCLGVSADELLVLARKHKRLDEHGVSVGGRLEGALPFVDRANNRVDDYLRSKRTVAPTGFELWDSFERNIARIKSVLGMSERDWSTFSGQLRHGIESADVLAKVLDLPDGAVRDIKRVTAAYRMRLTPYYASLIQMGADHDPVRIQSVPSREMIENRGVEIPPICGIHSPARLVDQLYPQVALIKVTNACAMYCTHCYRLSHISRRDHHYRRGAYQEAIDYIRANDRIRDVLITGGDPLMLSDDELRRLLAELDGIEHVTVKRIGTRIPVTAPMRIGKRLLEILAESNEKKPLRLITQINSAQEVTPVSRAALSSLSRHVSAVLNQTVLLRGVNDTRIKMWRLCETVQEAYVRPYYIFNCSFRNPQFAHLRVPVSTGRAIVESMYGALSGDAIPRYCYICTDGGKIPLHRDNVVESAPGKIVLAKPWSGERKTYPDLELDGASCWEESDCPA